MNKINWSLVTYFFCFHALPVFAQSNASEEAAMRASMLESLRDAVAGTPYSALVVHTRVTKPPPPVRSANPKNANSKKIVEEKDDDIDRYVYHARVLETFKGKAYATIRYEMIVEKGDGAPDEVEKEPQLLTLCKGPSGFYWPGVGASFPGDDPEVISTARRVAKQSVKRGAASKSQCD